MVLRELPLPTAIGDALSVIERGEANRVLRIDNGQLLLANDADGTLHVWRVSTTTSSGASSSSVTCLDVRAISGNTHARVIACCAVEAAGSSSLSVVASLSTGELLFWSDARDPKSLQRLALPAINAVGSVNFLLSTRCGAAAGIVVVAGTDRGRLLALDFQTVPSDNDSSNEPEDENDATSATTTRAPPAKLTLRRPPVVVSSSASRGLLSSLGAMLWRTPTANASSAAPDDASAFAAVDDEDSLVAVLDIGSSNVLTLSTSSAQVWRIDDDAKSQPSIVDQQPIANEVVRLLGERFRFSKCNVAFYFFPRMCAQARQIRRSM